MKLVPLRFDKVSILYFFPIEMPEAILARSVGHAVAMSRRLARATDRLCTAHAVSSAKDESIVPERGLYHPSATKVLFIFFFYLSLFFI